MKNKKEERVKFDFGNYYDDIIPDDANEVNNSRQNNNLWIRLSILGFFVVVVLAACVALLVLFGGE